jgi:chlorobactene glucosyltransferase
MIGYIFILSALVLIALVSVINALTFPRLGADHSLPQDLCPTVSILIPARDEAGVIAGMVRGLLSQAGLSGEAACNFKVLVLDDASSDGTGQAALQAAGADTHFCLLSSRGEQDDLPADWTGKNWACHRLSQQADGEILIFTDADMRWQPGALYALVYLMQRTQADVLTVWPTQEVHTWAERLVVPLMNFAIMGYLPELAVRFLPWASLAAANGQCIAFRRQAYERIGGHQAVRETVVEDVALARAAKRAGLRLVMALGDGLITGRMYSDWREVRHGFGKNILAGHGGQPLFLLTSTLLHWALFLLPWLLLFYCLLFSATCSRFILYFSLSAISLGVAARALSAAANRQPLFDALLLPISVLLLTIIAGQSLWWHFRQGGPQWKGRIISTRRARIHP